MPASRPESTKMMQAEKPVCEGLHSREILQKPEWSSVRALYKGMGYSDDDLDRPQIGVFNSFSSANPGNYNLNQVAQSVCRGILREGGNPVEIGVIGPCDGIGCGNSGMRFILPLTFPPFWSIPGLPWAGSPLTDGRQIIPVWWKPWPCSGTGRSRRRAMMTWKTAPTPPADPALSSERPIPCAPSRKLWV